MPRWATNIPLVTSVAAIVLATLVMVTQVVGLVSAALTPAVGEDRTRSRLNEYLDEHVEGMTTYRERFDGRSLFFKPKPPPRPKKPPPPVVDRGDDPPPPPAPPQAPRLYGGPSVIFVVGDQVWFHNGRYASVGEEVDGVKVIASDPPWSVTLFHAGREYEVPLFHRNELFDNTPSVNKNREFPGLKIAKESQ